MRHTFAALLVACNLNPTTVNSHAPRATSRAIVVENGRTQPVYSAAEAIRESVFVEAQMDSDHDGVADRIALDIKRPKETNEGLKVAVVMEASPYYFYREGSRLPYGHYNWYDEVFVPLGYAVVEVEMQGTSRSSGCPTTGGPEDTESVVAAIDWLNGRARGFDAQGNEVVATWSTGNVGMLGVSYNGTLPNAVAARGVEGLKTIVPIAAISSWYDYTRDAGIGYNQWSERYPQWLAEFVISGRALDKCKDVLTTLGDSAGDDTFDFTQFWQARDYRRDADNIEAAVFLVHGLADWNVKPANFSRLWERLQARNVPRKLWLHREGHTDPVWLLPEQWVDTMHRWMDHWLYGIDNGIMDEPMLNVQRQDGRWETHDSWPDATAVATDYHPTFTGSLQRNALVPPVKQTIVDDPTMDEDTLIATPEILKPYRLAWLGPNLGAPLRMSGIARIKVTAIIDAVSTPLTALLVDYGVGEDVPAENLTIAELMGRSCRLADLHNRTGCAAERKRVAQLTAARVVSRGSIDVKNRVSLETSTDIVPGKAVTVAWELHPVDYVFPAGHRFGIVLSANDADYIAVDPAAFKIDVLLDSTTFTLPIVP